MYLCVPYGPHNRLFPQTELSFYSWDAVHLQCDTIYAFNYNAVLNVVLKKAEMKYLLWRNASS